MMSYGVGVFILFRDETDPGDEGYGPGIKRGYILDSYYCREAEATIYTVGRDNGDEVEIREEMILKEIL